MKKVLKIFLFIILLSSFIMPNVYASSIKVNEITVKDKSGTISIADLELDDDGTITSNITFNQIHDFVTFDVEIENNENTPYALESITNNKNDYLTVEYEYGKIIQPGTKEHFNVTLKYSEELINHDDIPYNDLSLRLNYSNDINLINPQTSNPIQLFIKVLFILGIIFVCVQIYKKKHVKLFILLLLLIPFFTKAEEGKTLSINFSDIKVKARLLQYEIVIDLGNGEYQTVNETYGTTIEELPEPEKVGYSFVKWIDQDSHDVSNDTVIEGNMELTPVYEPIQYTITYNLGGGTVSSTNPVSYNIETNTFTLNNPTKPGYTFAGWRDEDTQEVQTRVVIEQGTINNKTYTATFSTNTNTPYTVIHKQQNLNDNDYTTYETENLTGATDSSVTPQRRTYTGFMAPSGQTVTISGDGTTTVTYLYTRNTYTFSVSDRTYVTGTSNGTYKYGYSISVTAQSRAGYNFKWSDNTTSLTKSFTLSGNTTLSAVYTARTDTVYTVIHQQQNLNDNNYTTVSTLNYTGTTGASITPAVNSYTGFTSPSTQTVTISGNGTTTVTYQYTRNSYTLTLTDSEYITTTTPSGSYKYGTSITLTAKTREGYTFTKWSDNTTTSTYTFTLTGNKTIGPVYEQSKVSVDFNANGGTVSPLSREILQGAEIGELPTPERDDYEFLGWYTDLVGGAKVYTNSTIDVSLTIYARWRDNSNKLYNALKYAEEDGLARKYTGEHQDSMDDTKCTKDIYYWYAKDSTDAATIKNKNNVIFGSQCWQMIRTTDTGGVKLLYNGEAVNNQCLDTRSNHMGYNYITSEWFSPSVSYYFGTDYTYDSSNKTFKISGDITQSYVNNNTIDNLIGKYTCKSGLVDTSCSTLYVIYSRYSSDESYAYAYSINSSSNYSQFGTIQYNYNGGSISDAGYKYNERYSYNVKDSIKYDFVLDYSYSSYCSDFWVASSYTWDSSEGKYTLVNPTKITSSNYSSATGKYTFFNTTQDYKSNVIKYISKATSSTYYFFEYGKNNETYNYTYTYGSSYTKNLDGTYTINSPTTIERKKWYDNYSYFKNRYICINAVNNTCSDLRYGTWTEYYRYSYLLVSEEYKFSNSFDYVCDDSDNCKYVLDDSDIVNFWDSSSSSNVNKLKNHHYTCFNDTGECEQINYVFYLYSNKYKYFKLSNGEDIGDALDKMLNSDDVNTYESSIKMAIDRWYSKYLSSYSDYIEDTIFCNNRVISNLGSLDENNGSVGNYIYFQDYYKAGDLICPRETDRFSTQNNKAKLNYPVGLLTAPEVALLGDVNTVYRGNTFFLMSPSDFSGNDFYAVSSSAVNSSGISNNSVSSNYGVRPSVSLLPNIEYSSGDGSKETPYVIKYEIPQSSSESSVEPVHSITYPVGKDKSTVQVGDIVKIGYEEFYVIQEANSNSDDLVLLSHYNLNVGDYKKPGAISGIQSDGVFGSRSGYSTYGGVMFSTSNYWDGKIGTDYSGDLCSESSQSNCANVYDQNSALYTYIDSYKTYLQGLEATIKSARLMTLEEANRFIETNSEQFYETSFWLGTPKTNTDIWCSYPYNSTFANIYYSSSYSFGIRPVIVI